MRLSLRHTYMPKVTVDFAGPSYFGGKHDQLVLCAGKGELFSEPYLFPSLTSCPAGDIHIWDRESATLLHHIRSQTVGGDLTCIAWNHAWDSFMFATGSHDGGVRIWTSPMASASSPELSAAASRVTITPANTPRSATPNPYDADYRTDSPTVQLASTPEALEDSPAPVVSGPPTSRQQPPLQAIPSNPTSS